MQFLDQKKRSVVVNGERVWEDDPRYRDLTDKKKSESAGRSAPTAADKEEEEWREEQWKEDSAKIKAWFTPALFAKVAAWIALFYYLGPYARPALVFATFFALIFLNLGKREEGELSAYNVFNPNFQRLQGDNLAEQFEAQLRNVPVQQLRNRQQQQLQGRTRPASASTTAGDSGEESEVDINSLKPRDKVIVSHHQGGKRRFKTMKWKHAEVFVRTEGWSLVEVLGGNRKQSDTNNSIELESSGNGR